MDPADPSSPIQELQTNDSRTSVGARSTGPSSRLRPPVNLPALVPRMPHANVLLHSHPDARAPPSVPPQTPLLRRPCECAAYDLDAMPSLRPAASTAHSPSRGGRRFARAGGPVTDHPDPGDLPPSPSAVLADSGTFTSQKSATWDWLPRSSMRPTKTPRPHEQALAVREWVSIPDANLPGPWTCNWACWPFWTHPCPLEVELAARYALGAPLAPVMFSSFDATTVFACAARRHFYLYYQPLPSVRTPPPVTLVVFEGLFPSVEAFIEGADWNRVQELTPSRSWTFPRTCQFPLVSSGGKFRVAEDEPYPKRTLWDMCPPPGTYGYTPRTFDAVQNPKLSLDSTASASGRARLKRNSLSRGRCQVEQYRLRARLHGLIPAMFVPLGPWRGDTVLCPPGGAGTYYLYWNEIRRTGEEWGEWDGEMYKFDGLYASVAHFVRVADWNRLEKIPVNEPRLEDHFYWPPGYDPPDARYGL
ncbi:hypothetical protein B0H17DRAFT_1207562 [Mycena rosella]|uniref:Uncharacterized protein n=1 Tax=Mycena rosella TaxID=1033263 RepID=A0AAD7D2I3_MYCRO|nr:hypothetical protein B0H17DRAFT_1207562 [Mycena rosella]